MAHSLEVVFHGATLLVIEHSSQPYVPMKPVVSGMGLAWQSQLAKLTGNAQRWGITEIVIPTASGEQGMSCLPLRKLPGWLATISPNKVRPELREKVIAYQNEADDVLWAAWQDQQPIVEPQQMRLDYDRISPAQAQDLKEIVDAIVKAGVQNYGETWKRLQHKFRVNSYLELPATQHLEARAYLIAKLPKGHAEGVVDEEPPLATDNEKIKHAFALASEVAKQAAMTVFNAVIDDQDVHKHDRWMFHMDWHARNGVPAPWAKPIEGNAMVVSMADLPRRLLEPNGMLPTNKELADLATACNQRLAQRMQYEASKAQANAA